MTQYKPWAYFFVFCFLMISAASSLQAEAVAAKPLSEFEVMYRQAYQFEKIRLFRLAQEAYIKTNEAFFAAYNKSDKKIDLLVELPVIISSVFRLSVVTGKNNFFTMNKLIEQIETFENTNTQINQLLKMIVASKELESSIFRRRYIGILYFARAYNNLGLAYKLLYGISWKNYIVYPLTDILGIVEYAIKDFNQGLMFEGVPYQKYALPIETQRVAEILTPTGSVLALENEVSSTAPIMDVYSDMKNEFYALFTNEEMEPISKTYLLTNFEDNPDALAQIVAKRCYYQAFQLLDFYYSDETREIISHAKENYRLENILNENNQAVFSIITQLVDYLGLRK